MDLRDAVEADAERLASLTEAPRDVMENLVHDRTVRVAEADEAVRGFVSYDAREQTVYVTQIAGEADLYPQLLAEPVGFAATEDMAVELLVPADDEAVQSAATAADFERVGTGPRFDGVSTVRYRLENP